MKKLLTILFLAHTCVFGQMNYDNKITVVHPWQVGLVPDVMCRKIMDSYDALYGSNTVHINMPGGDHIIAHRHFLTMTEPNLFCAGVSVAGINQITNENSPKASTLKPVILITKFTHFILTPIDRPENLDIMMRNAKKSGEKLMLGAQTTHSIKLVAAILDKNKVAYEVVMYKRPTDAIVDMQQGTLDLFVDGGTLKNLMQSTFGYKELANISSGKNKSDSENLSVKYPLIASNATTIIMYVNSNVSDEAVAELNKRLNNAIAQPSVQSFYKEVMPYHTPVNTNITDTKKQFRIVQENIKHVYN